MVSKDIAESPTALPERPKKESEEQGIEGMRIFLFLAV